MNNNKPTFLGIGAHKAGTSWLYKQLIGHPEVYMPPKKEIHFFDRSPRYLSPNALAESSPLLRPFKLEPRDLRKMSVDFMRMVKCALTTDFERAEWYQKWLFGYYNEDWYTSLFHQSARYNTCGEISPSYSILESQDIARIKDLNPDMKLILMLRDPIDRAWSNIRFGSDRGRLDVNLESPDDIIEALQQPKVVLRGDYERTLNNYLEHFDSSQVLVCFYEAIKHDPVGLMAGVTAFLGISAFAEGNINYQKRVNASKPRPMPRVVKDYLLEIYAPKVERIAKTLGSYANIWEGMNTSLDNIQPSGAARDLQMLPTLHP